MISYKDNMLIKPGFIYTNVSMNDGSSPMYKYMYVATRDNYEKIQAKKVIFNIEKLEKYYPNLFTSE